MPSIHMPRWACRFVLEITAIRVERLHDITEADVRAEGFRCWTKDGHLYKWAPAKLHVPSGEVDPDDAWTDMVKDPVEAFAKVWRRLNGDASWDRNPFVVVRTFKILEGE